MKLALGSRAIQNDADHVGNSRPHALDKFSEQFFLRHCPPSPAEARSTATRRAPAETSKTAAATSTKATTAPAAASVSTVPPRAAVEQQPPEQNFSQRCSQYN